MKDSEGKESKEDWEQHWNNNKYWNSWKQEMLLDSHENEYETKNNAGNLDSELASKKSPSLHNPMFHGNNRTFFLLEVNSVV